MIPAQLQKEAEAAAGKHCDGKPFSHKEQRGFVAGVRWLFQRLCEMSEESLLSYGPSVAAKVVELDAALLKAKEEVAQLNIRVKALDKTDEHYANLMIKHRDEANERFYQERARCDRLEKALKTLMNEVKGTLSAHELAIRYDSGNSNWQCLEMALEQARQALSGESDV